MFPDETCARNTFKTRLTALRAKDVTGSRMRDLKESPQSERELVK